MVPTREIRFNKAQPSAILEENFLKFYHQFSNTQAYHDGSRDLYCKLRECSMSDSLLMENDELTLKVVSKLVIASFVPSWTVMLATA